MTKDVEIFVVADEDGNWETGQSASDAWDRYRSDWSGDNPRVFRLLLRVAPAEILTLRGDVPAPPAPGAFLDADPA